jgi:integrase
MGKVVTLSRFGDSMVTSGHTESHRKRRPQAGARAHVVKLTKDRVGKAAYQGDGKSRFVIWDLMLTGIGVRVYPSGKKSYVISYRFEGRKRLHTLGKVEAFRKVVEARDLGRDILANVSKGIDPQDERAKAHGSPSMRDLYERYMREHARPHKKPSSIRDDERMWQKIILPKLGHRRVEEMRREDIHRIHTSLGKTPYQANRVLALLSKAFNFSELWEWRPQNTNPTEHIRRYKETKRERLISEDELSRLAEVLDEVEESGHVTVSPDGGGMEVLPSIPAAIRLLIFTGMRVGEVINLKWDSVDFERRVLQLSESKTGPKVVFLNEPALEILQHQLEISPASEWVFLGKELDSPQTPFSKTWARILTKAQIDDLRLHDLRHNFGSVGAGLNMSLPLIARMLGHTQTVTTERYAHLADNPVQAAAEEVGKVLSERMKNSANGDL